MLQKISDAPLKKCAECGKNQLQKLVSAPSFRLAGGGWYETDFKSDKDKKRNLVETEKGEAKTEDKKPEVKPEAKPEKKEESKAEAKPADKPDKKQPAAKSAKKKARR